MKVAARCACLAAFFLITCPGLTAQSSGSADGQSSPNPINLNVVVTGHKGAPIVDLRKSDFTILDNKVPQKITSFQNMSGKQVPVEVVIVMDDVNTGFFYMPDERRQMEKFLQSNGGKLPYPTSLLFFTDAEAPVPQSFTQDGNKLAKKVLERPISERPISKSAGAGGDADRYAKSLRMLAQTIESVTTSAGRTIVIWVSPGWPLLNGPGNSLSKSDQSAMFTELENFTGDLRKNQVTLYMINPEGVSNANAFHNGGGNSHALDYEQFLKPVRKARSIQCGNLSLQGMVLHSGGLVQGWSNNIAGMMQKVMDDIPNYYDLTYNAPSDQPNRYHAIEVKVDRRGVKARTTAGYYSGY